MRFILPILVVALLAPAARARAAPRIAAHIPAVATAGQWLTVSGWLSGLRGRVALEQRAPGGDWSTRARTRSAAGGRFAPRWRAPRAGAVTPAGVPARRGRRRILSPAQRVAVSAT